MRVILIISDTFRHDLLAKEGKMAASTPELDQLIEDSVFFERHYAGSFPTVPHRFDMYTGTCGFPYRGWEILGPKDITLGEILMDHGYITQLIADTANLLRRGMNYDRGYLGYYLTRGQERDIYLTKMNRPIEYVIPLAKSRHTTYFRDHAQVDVARWINDEWLWEEDRFAARTCQVAGRWLESNYKEENFFLHLDMFDPHEPWDPPEYFISKYADPEYKGTPMMYPNYGPADIFTEAEIDNMSAHYKAEAEMTSKWIGNVIRKIKDVGIYDESLIIFASDHGLYLGEHNRTGKLNISKDDNRGPWPLYEELIRVPLAIKMPGNKLAGKRITEIVQPVDLLPTILDIAGISTDQKLPGKALLPDREIIMENPGIILGREKGLNPLDGKSLVPLMENDAISWDRKYAFSSQKVGRVGGQTSGPMPVLPEAEDTVNWITVTGKQHALVIGGKRDNLPELYDLESDRQQANNIFSEKRELAREMADALFTYLEQNNVESDLIDLYRTRLDIGDKTDG